MKVLVNNASQEVARGTSLDGVVIGCRGVAAAVNGVVVPAGSWSATELKDGDVIDVLTPVQGG